MAGIVKHRTNTVTLNTKNTVTLNTKLTAQLGGNQPLKDNCNLFTIYTLKHTKPKTMTNNLPKSWAVKNDQSEKFKNTVGAYLEKQFSHGYSYNLNGYYGIDKSGDCIEGERNAFDTILTIDEFISLTRGETPLKPKL